MPDNTNTSPNCEITGNGDIVAELKLDITIITLPQNGGRETVVTKVFRVPHSLLVLNDQCRRGMIHYMLQGTPLDRDTLRMLEKIISKDCLLLYPSVQQAFVYFFRFESEDLKQGVLRFVKRAMVTEIESYTEMLREARALLWRCCAVERVTVAVASSEKKPSCAICLTEISGDDEVKAGRLPCSHLFHFRCIIQWLLLSNSCPLCRSQPSSSGN